ncbi:RHS repeat-associated core domain-containing protein, partial [Chryseobacterium salviniae]
LEYVYSGNRLVKIVDHSFNPTGYEGGSNAIGYDENGNMISMPDKQINQIGYNYLNLPNSLNIENNKKKLFHLYRADGSKLKKILNYLKDDGNTFTTITEYLDGFQYLTTMGTAPNEFDPMEFAYEQEAFIEKILQEEPIAALQFFPTAEGFYDYENNEYIYQYKDHLGNVRVSYKKDSNGYAEITDQNDYYPFGMNILREEKAIFGVNSLYNYKYNGKELQETGMYDYGARFYMPDIGRWGVVDPMAEKMRRHSPYNYAFNNPIRFIDPDGRKPVPPDDHFDQNGNYLYTDNRKTNNIVVNYVFGKNRQENISLAKLQAPWQEKKLSDIEFNKGNYSTLTKIANHYAKDAGVDLSKLQGNSTSLGIADYHFEAGQMVGKTSSFNGGKFQADALMTGDIKTNTISIMVGNETVHPFLDNKYNMISALSHEGGEVSHLTLNPQTWIEGEKAHMTIYENQMKSPIFKLTTEDFQKKMKQNYREAKSNYETYKPKQ